MKEQVDSNQIRRQLNHELGYLGTRFLDELIRHSVYKSFPPDTVILNEGDTIRYIPLVIKGLIKVISRYEDKEILLYYIQPFQSCIMSFSAAISSEPAIIHAATEEETEALLVPVSKMNAWIVQFPELNRLFFQQYKIRYAELLDTINHMMYHRLDKRIYDHLAEKSKLKGNRQVQITHKQIANELGTAREVVTRILKKLEVDKKIKQTPSGVEILNSVT